MIGPLNDIELTTNCYPKISVDLLSISFNVLLIRPNRVGRRCQVTLVEHSQLIRLESAHNRVKQPPVVEDNQITFFPILRVDQSRSDARSLDFIQDFTDSLKIVNDTTFGVESSTFGRRYVKLVGTTRMNLHVQSTSDRVLPALRMTVSD